MIGLGRLRRLNWQLVGLATSAIIVLNLISTLIAPEIASAPALERLAHTLPVNTMQIMSPVTANKQPLPFLSPDAHYAMCRYDTSKGTVAITASLPDPGWTLSLYSEDGDSFYAAVAQPGRDTNVSLELIATDDRFAGLSAEARGQLESAQSTLTLVATKGLAVLRAPDMGYAFKSRHMADLARAVCTLKR